MRTQNPLSRRLAAALAIACAAVFGTPAAAQTPPRQQVCDDLFPAVGPEAGDLFACALSFEPGVVAIGSVLDDERGEDAGAVFVLKASNGVFLQAAKLFAGDAAARDELGFAVSLSGDRLVAGAPLRGDHGQASGAAYVFHRGQGGWAEEAKLSDPGLGTLDQLGYAVALDGDTAAVGAPGDDDRAAGGGAVYLFRRGEAGWALLQKLTASDGAAGDGFGLSVALDGGLLLVGAPFDDDGGSASGSVYVFEETAAGWVERQKLAAGDASPNALFGHAVALEGELAAVGARFDGGAGFHAGAAYVFRRRDGLFAEEARLAPAALAAGDELGTSVAIDAGRVLVGARFDDQAAADSGAAHLFELRPVGWVETAKIKSAAPAAGDELGYALGLAGDKAVLGIYRDDARGPDAGAACILELGVPPTDLRIHKRVDRASAAPGDTLRYTVTVTNQGQQAVAGARVRDDLPAALGSASWTCSASPGASCTASGEGAIDDTVSLPAGGSVVYTIEARVVRCDGGPIVNEAQVEPPEGVADATPEDNLVRVETPVEANLSVTLACGASPPGGDCAYTLTAVNDGPCPVAVARLESAVPEGLDEVRWSCTPAGGATCRASGQGPVVDAPALPVGGSAVYRVAGTPQPGFGGPLRPAATLAPPQGVVDPVLADNTAGAVCADCPPAVEPADVKVTVEALAASLGEVAFRLTVQNLGHVPAEAVSLANPTPAGLTFASATAPCEGGFPCQLGTFEAGAEVAVDVVYQVDCTAGLPASFTDTATVATSSTESDLTNNRSSATVPVPADACTADLEIDKDAPGSVQLGAPLAYTVTVTNHGPAAVRGAPVTDHLPPAFAGATWSCAASPGGSCPASGVGDLVGEEVDLPAGGTAVFTLIGSADLAPCGELSNLATVAPPPGVVDPVLTNNASSSTTVVFPGAGLCGSKRLLPGPHGEGATVTYEILVVNGGPGALADGPDDEFRDDLPSGLTLLVATADRGVVATLGNTVLWNGSLAVGEAVTIVVQAQVDPGTQGQTICNQGVILPVTLAIPTDDPSLPGLEDPTCFDVEGIFVVPTLSSAALALLALLLALAGGGYLRRRRRGAGGAG